MAKFEDLRDITAESGIIATLINNPSFINFCDNLDYSCFSDETNALLYEIIYRLYKDGITKIDAFNIYSTYSSNEKLCNKKAVSLDVEFINEIIENSKFIARSTSEEYNRLARSVIGFAYRRKLYMDLQRAQADILTTNDITALQRSVAGRVESTTERYIVNHEIGAMGRRIEELYGQTLSRQGPDGVIGFTTSFMSLNEYFTYEAGECIIYAGYLKTGKSFLLLGEALNILLKQKSRGILIIDTEMSDRLFSERLICVLSGVAMRVVKNGRGTEEEKDRIKKAICLIKKLPLYHYYTPILNLDEVYGLVKNMKNKGMIDTVFWDYIKSGEADSASSVYLSLGLQTNFIKNVIAGDLGLCVIGGAQLNRAGQIGDSLRISQYASTIVKIQKKTFDEIYQNPDCGSHKLIVIANRLGLQMDESEEWIDVDFNQTSCRFFECKQHTKDSIL